MTTVIDQILPDVWFDFDIDEKGIGHVQLICTQMYKIIGFNLTESPNMSLN